MSTIPKLALIPSGYKASKVYSVLPTNGDGDFTFSRTSNATRVNENGLIETVGSNVPRLDYSHSSCPSLLLEPQRTNLITYSEDFSQWSDEGDAFVQLSDVISPDGNQNAYTVTNASDLSLGGDYIGRPITGLTSSATYIFSIYIKLKTATTVKIAIRDGSTGAVVKSSALTAQGWNRLTVSKQNGVSTTTIAVWIGDADGTFDIWGAQLEEGSYATSYIPTEGSTVTRLADVCNNSGSSDLINSTEGVLYAEISANGVDGGKWISLSNGTTNERVSIAFQAEDIRLYIKNTSGLIWDYTYTSANIFNDNKIGLKYKSGDYALWINGTEVSTSSNSNLPSGLNSLQFDSGGGSLNFYGNVKYVAVFKEALTDAELQTLTTL